MVKVELRGKLAPGVTGKDVIVALCGSFNQDEVLNAAIEFTGEGVKCLSVDDRLTISNMTTEWGALVGVFPVDETTLEWYDIAVKKQELRTFSTPSSDPALASSIPPPQDHPRINRKRISELKTAISTYASDPNAQYSSHLIFDLSTLVPHVSGPNSVKVSTPLPELEASKIAIQKAYLVSCTNSRVSDIAAAADVLKNRKVAPGVEFYIAAASSVVQREAEELGHWDILISAGATNRNYKGRMGHPKAQAYLSSPAIVAASAVKGHICGPDSLDPNTLPKTVRPTFSISKAEGIAPTVSFVEVEPPLTGFPSTFRGPLVFAPQDNLNTDGIYPGKYTYQDDITLEKQAEVVMENYDPAFAALVASIRRNQRPSPPDADAKEGVILVSGYNFGTGSSREQAATALKAAGIPLVIAGSFGDIFKRNAINNGLVCIESPELVQDLTEAYAKDGKRGAGGKDGALTVNGGHSVSVKVVEGVVEVKYPEGGLKTYKVGVLGSSVQELWLCGGLEGFVLKSIQQQAA
jgi:homoaconitate hydratase